jgi:hypothetical protein
MKTTHTHLIKIKGCSVHLENDDDLQIRGSRKAKESSLINSKFGNRIQLKFAGSIYSVDIFVHLAELPKK